MKWARESVLMFFFFFGGGGVELGWGGGGMGYVQERGIGDKSGDMKSR